MKLYYSPGACSAAVHILLEDLGEKYETVKVDLQKKTTEEGDYYKVNPNGYVPALKLDNGQIMTEDAVILQYLADLKPELQLIPKAGSMERYQLLQRLHFISTELHKGFSPLFAVDRIFPENKEAAAQLTKATIEKLKTRFSQVEKYLSESAMIAGENFTIADAYLFVVLRWSKSKDISLSAWPKLEAYFKKLAARPSVAKALSAEGIQL